MESFHGKTALITGASAGIGAALSREFAREGAAVALLARRAERLEALRAEIEEAGGRAISISCDVTREGDLERAVAETVEKLGRIDVAVANAGYGVVGNLEDLSLDDYRRQLETNVFGLLRTCKAALAELKRTRGVLVLLGSVAGHLSAPGASAYAMSKFAVRALAEALHGELEPQGISTVLISPGFIETEFRQVDNRGLFHPEMKDPVPPWLVLPKERAARKILKAVRKRRREAVIPLHGKLAVFLARHFPRLTGWLLRRLWRARPEPGKAGAGKEGT